MQVILSPFTDFTALESKLFSFLYLFWANVSMMSRKGKVELSSGCTDNRLMGKREKAVTVVRDVFSRRARENARKIVGER